MTKWQRGKCSRVIAPLGLALVLTLALFLPATVYAAKPDARPNTSNVEIVKKEGAKGVPLLGPPSNGPKPHAVTGILGEPVTGERYAIIIGISDYPGPYHVLQGGYDLSYADDDAIAMKEALMAYGFEEDNICLLVDSSATREAVLTEIANLKGSLSQGDEVVFFFSGHGAKRVSKPTEEFSGGGKVGIVTWGWENPAAPTDFYLEVIWDKDLKEAFSGFQTDRIIFIFDSCLSGGMIDLGEKGTICMATTQNGFAVEYGEDYEPYYPETPGLEPINHGLFTYFFVELGMREGYADFYPADGNVTVEETFEFSRFYLEMIGIATDGLLRQIPTIKDSFGKDLLP